MQNLSTQLFAFGVTVCGGFLLGLLFDFYRVARGVIRPKKIITHLGDLIFWIISTFIIFLFLLLGNWGEIRLYVFIGLLLGSTIYLKIFSSRVIKTILLIIKAIRTIKLEIVKVVLFLYRIVGYPVNLIRRVVLIPVGLIGSLLISIKTGIRRILSRLTIKGEKKDPPP
ncbi:spore cortex biosynthesis protein YabQ [Thermincola ferriacetica]|uniref:Spore cortex biosynthesis protein YabQ n=1 Tax=Thermincola ferriacetica TaxID=281456 RepID=A0A0L6VZZ0_9FIRM|nr:spore cortex biosynthesis protein YabQ [Thermincola ferriacetica]KNZ68892.1 spore cortex biosynthesis protein YabQ [Thermincola ferriacetica]